MAGLKKSSKKDSSSPNIFLVVFLIVFILASIGLGVFGYYGYEGQEKLRQDARAANKKAESLKETRDMELLVAKEGMLALGEDLSPDEKTLFTSLKDSFVREPEKFKDVEALLKRMTKDNADNLGGYNANEVKYGFVYKTKIKESIEEAKKSKAFLDDVKKEYEEFKKNYESLNAKYEKDTKDMLDRIAKGNQDALAAALKTNTKFPEVQKLLVQREEDIKKLSNDLSKEIEDRDGRISRLKDQVSDLEKKLNDRGLGIAATPQSGATDIHALMLDVSRGIPLWDRPLGKIVRVDSGNLLVTIDMGSKKGLKPDLTFNVFATGFGGQADRQLKGTVEVVRILNESTSVCRITSLFDERGEQIPLVGESVRGRAMLASDNILKEGDLLFHSFFDMHVVIAGNVNFNGYPSDSPAAQNLQLNEFITLLRKHNIVVDGYINLLNGQIEGTITPRTRLIIRGEIAQINRTEEESNRFKLIVDSYQTMKQKAIDQGMFIISAENFMSVIGYRSPQSQTNRDLASTFRPILPWVGGPTIQRFDRAVEGQPGAAPAAPAPMPEMKKDAEVK